MIKTGIYKPSQIKGGLKFGSLFGGGKRLSITLLDQVLDKPNAEELAERILLLFADERGAYKRTYAKRFEEFDSTVLCFLENVFDKQSLLFVHDVGVSDARTSADFFQKASRIFANVQFTASDFDPTVYVLEQGKLRVTISSAGKVLEIVWPPFVFNAIRGDSYKHYPLNHLVRFIIHRFKVSPLLRDYELGKVKARELLLFTPAAVNLSRKDPRYTLGQHDLLQPFKDQSHVIRAMNILNPSYFSNEEFSRVLKNIHKGLADGGLLITGSNEGAGSPVNGGLYMKRNKAFEKLWQSGEGSPMENQIVQFKLTA
jgi:hypothetical protein